MYLKHDVFALTDKFQKYIDTCRSAYGKIPLSPYSGRSFISKARVKHTRRKRLINQGQTQSHT